MRTYEVLLWAIASGWVGWWVVRRPGRLAGALLTALALIAAVLHVVVEGVRFHMVPTYILLAGLLALSVRRWPLRHPSRWRTWLRHAAAIPVGVCVILAAALPTLFPVYNYAQPTGPYGIGTATYELKGAPLDRSLVVQAWYPTAPGLTGTPSSITSRTDLLQTAYASFTGLPRPLFDNMRLVRTHAMVGAPMAPVTATRRKFPVVLFSHGPLSANRSQSIFQMEALASHGIIVFAIDHTGYASTTIFPDGHETGPDERATWPVFVDQKSSAMLRTWVGDVRFVVDRLEELNESDTTGLLSGRLDLDRVGYMGASFGGSVVVQALLEEPRIKAGLAQDGKPYFFDNTIVDLRRPLMYMQSATPYIQVSDAQLAKWGLTADRFKVAEQDHYTRLMRLVGSASAPVHNIYIRGTNHVTFSDLYLIIRLPNLDLMDIRRAHQIINDYTIAFFERYLSGSSGRLVDGTSPSPYPEVTAVTRNVACLCDNDTAN
jgi:predicted dienelactone hydrolase